MKKVAKWQCKICNEKQMTQVVYFRGAGAECRKYVQAQNLKNAGGKELAVIDAWGFDCEAEQDSCDPCDCSERKSAAEKLSSYLTSGDFEEENFASSQNSSKRQKLNCGRKHPRSLPSRHLQQYSNECCGKSGSYPVVNKGTQFSNKYDKFLEPRSVSEAPEEDNEARSNKWQQFLDSVEETGADGCESSSKSPSASGGTGNSWKTRANDLGNDLELEEQETEASGALICSQVDESSNNSQSPKANIANYIFEDSDDDLDFELDF